MLTKNLPDVIPPKTIVRLATYDDDTPLWKDKLGTVYCVGYYNRQDGIDTIWLVDGDGNYCETLGRDDLLKYFNILQLTETTDYYGDNSPTIKGITKVQPYSVLEEVPPNQS